LLTRVPVEAPHGDQWESPAPNIKYRNTAKLTRRLDEAGFCGTL
jgi:hypothetical protein